MRRACMRYRTAGAAGLVSGECEYRLNLIGAFAWLLPTAKRSIAAALDWSKWARAAKHDSSLGVVVKIDTLVTASPADEMTAFYLQQDEPCRDRLIPAVDRLRFSEPAGQNGIRRSPTGVMTAAQHMGIA